MRLIVDAGNTRVKLAQFQEEKLQNVSTFNDQKSLDFFLKNLTTPSSAIISNVGKWHFSLLPKSINHVLELNTDSKLPFRSNYTTPDTLGKDRKALVAAALNEFPQENCLVLDAGSCLTADLLDHQGIYQGGSISPGLYMRFRALNQFTANLPALEYLEGEMPKLIGDSTRNSILSGVVRGYVAEISSLIEQYKKEFVDLRVVLCGGDTSLLLPWLKNDIFAPSNFLIKGLDYILRYNLESIEKR